MNHQSLKERKEEKKIKVVAGKPEQTSGKIKGFGFSKILKICTICRKPVPLKDFYTTTRKGSNGRTYPQRLPRCKPCHRTLVNKKRED